MTKHADEGRVDTDDHDGVAASDDRLVDPRVLVTGTLVLVGAALRTCSRSLRLCGEHSGSLIRLTADATSGSDSAPTSRQVLRDELFGLMREIAGVSWHESRRAIDELDLRTRTTSTPVAEPARPYRVKP